MSTLKLKAHLREKMADVLTELGLPSENVRIEPCKSPEFGDLSTNVALVLAKKAKRPSLELANEIRDRLDISPGVIEAVSVSTPGFVNFTISPSYLRQQVAVIVAAGDDFGSTNSGKGKRALVEFVSANPTGPLTVGHGRQAVLGDVVANILEWHGYEVTREYYFNDAGRQMTLLGASVYARYLELLGEEAPIPEGGYEGEYIRDIAAVVRDSYGDSLKANGRSPLFKETAERLIFDDIKSTLDKIDIQFDEFVNEKTFYENKAVEGVIEALRDRGLAYDREGAVWFKTTEFGKSQDTVLIKKTGEPTYRLPDIAYHQFKLDRGFDLIVDIFGADHKDTYPDVLSGLEALGYSTAHIQVLIHQFVTLREKGQKVKMSTRKATFVTLEDLIDRAGPDVVRYFFIMRNMQSHLNFDLDLATKESEENPVYYLQYAHARICNIIKFGEESNVEFDTDADLSLIAERSEINLLKALILFPEVAETALNTLEPQIIANYLQAVATRFHKFYSEWRVISDDLPLSQARLALISATRIVLANGLKILGISRPERM